MLRCCTLTSVRCPWLISLALAVFVIVSGQVRAFDACDADQGSNSDDVTFSVLDDGFVALPGVAPPDLSFAPTGTLLFPVLPPSGRLVVPDLFRPPIRIRLSV